MGSELARRASAFELFHEGVFRAAFELRHDISNLTSRRHRRGCRYGCSGLPPGYSASTDGQRVMENKSEAERFSALGFPDFMLGSIHLSGFSPKRPCRLLFERFLAQRCSTPQA